GAAHIRAVRAERTAMTDRPMGVGVNDVVEPGGIESRGGDGRPADRVRAASGDATDHGSGPRAISRRRGGAGGSRRRSGRGRSAAAAAAQAGALVDDGLDTRTPAGLSGPGVGLGRVGPHDPFLRLLIWRFAHMHVIPSLVSAGPLLRGEGAIEFVLTVIVDK